MGKISDTAVAGGQFLRFSRRPQKFIMLDFARWSFPIMAEASGRPDQRSSYQ
jgi:hypothetical protein